MAMDEIQRQQSTLTELVATLSPEQQRRVEQVWVHLHSVRVEW